MDGFEVEEVIEQREILRDFGSTSKRRELLLVVDNLRGLVLENHRLMMTVARALNNQFLGKRRH